MSIKSPQISVIVPVYNVEKFLSRCIKSIMNQTFKEFELILINDGSTDGSLCICEYYSKLYPNITLISQTNMGVSIARNRGIDLAVGDYCCFIDSDDYIEPNFLSSMLEAINEYNADLVCCGCWRELENKKYEWIRKSKKNFVYNQKEAIIELFSANSYSGWPWNKMYKTQIIKNNNILFPDDIRYCEDEIFVLKYILHCNKVVYQSQVLYHYLVNNNSVNLKMISRKEFDYNFLDRLRADKICYTILEGLNDKELLYRHKARQFASNWIVLQKILNCNNMDKKLLKKIQKNLLNFLPYYIKYTKLRFRYLKYLMLYTKIKYINYLVKL